MAFQINKQKNSFYINFMLSRVIILQVQWKSIQSSKTELPWRIFFMLLPYLRFYYWLHSTAAGKLQISLSIPNYRKSTQHDNTELCIQNGTIQENVEQNSIIIIFEQKLQRSDIMPFY